MGFIMCNNKPEQMPLNSLEAEKAFIAKFRSLSQKGKKKVIRLLGSEYFPLPEKSNQG